MAVTIHSITDHGSVVMPDRTIRELQSSLPWTAHYHRDFRATPMTHKDFAHALLHVHKAGGALAALVNDAEHGGVDWAAPEPRRDVGKYAADLVICALRLANTCPDGVIDLQRAVEDRLAAKNNQFAAERPALAAGERSAAKSPTPALPGVGEPFGGGFMAGRILIEGKTWALVVAPRNEGERPERRWKTDWSTSTPGTQSLSDGFENTRRALESGDHPAARFCRDLRVGGFDDWYLPSRDELEILYRAFKPTGSSNWTSGNAGRNGSSDPEGPAYTKENPAQTAIEAFRAAAAEAFAEAWYWSSTEFSADAAWRQNFGGGVQSAIDKNNALRVRAVRKVLIS